MFAICITACKDNTPELPYKADSSKPIGVQTAADSVYVALHFNMPTRRRAKTTSGMTGESSTGTEDEYAFHDGILVLFAADTDHPEDEQKSTLHSAYAIPQLADPSFDIYNVGRTTYTVAMSRKKVEELRSSEMRFFIMINPCDQFYVNNNDLWRSDHTQIAKGISYEDFSATICTDFGNALSGFLMTNAPMLTRAGGDAETKIRTLAEAKSIFFNLKAAESATDEETTIVFVERAAAKVTINKVKNPLQQIYIDGDDSRRASLGDIFWTLDNTNKGFYLSRHIDTDWSTIAAPAAPTDFRFVYTIPTDGYFRSLWAIDPNYDNYTGTHTGATGTDEWDTSHSASYVLLSGVTTDAQITIPCTEEGSTVYITENTFSPRCLTWYNTTRIVLKAYLLDDTNAPLKNYYVVSVTGSNNIYTSEATVRDAIIDWYDNTCGDYKDLTELSNIDGETILSATTITHDATTGKVTFTIDASATVFSAIDATKREKEIDFLKDLLEQDSYFFSEPMYFSQYIAHFGASQTPWNKELGAPFTTQITDTYDHTYYHNGDDSHLTTDFFGRWGVVRDHWYRLTLHTISHAGSPVVPNPDPNTPDDQIDNAVTFVPGFPIDDDIDTPQW